MKRTSLTVAVLLLAACAERPEAATAAPAGSDPRPAKLGLCIACHGDTGISRIPGTPHIAGQDEVYLRRSLTQYRDNRRQGGAMNAAAGSLSDADIRELAAWYASRPWLDAPPADAAPAPARSGGAG